MGFLGPIGIILAVVCAAWTIYDVFTVQKNMTKEHKIVWTVCAILFSIITAIVYYFLIKHK